MPQIVPVELTLASGRWFTLYQRGWDDAGTDNGGSLAFLGGNDRVYAFPTADALAAYAGAHDDHHLGCSPLWAEVRHRFDFSPVRGDRYDLTAPDPRAQEMLSELLVYLRIRPPDGDWSHDPLAAVLPRPGTVTGLPPGVGDPRPAGGLLPWDWAWAVEQVDARIGAPPASTDRAAPGAATPLEELAPGVEVLWLGLDGQGAFTLASDDGDGGAAFLGEPGELRAARTPDGLAAYVGHAPAGFLDLAPWWALRGRSDLDYEPYEDNVTDLDELADLLTPRLDRMGAQDLLGAWGLLRQLADWTGADGVVAALEEDAPLGRFLVRDVLDLSSGSVIARARLGDVALDEVRGAWLDCVAAIADRVVWVEDDPDSAE